MDSTITLAFLVTLISIISPVMTSIINKSYDLKVKSAELRKESLSVSYDRMYETFKTFLVDSSVVILQFDSDNKPTIEEFKKFESSCLSCFLFLNENERKIFEDFRILIKMKMGYDDPRPKTVLQLAWGYDIYKAHAALEALSGKKGDELFVSFNKCISIANQKLDKVTQEESQLLSSIRKAHKFSIPIHLNPLQDRNKKDTEE